MARVPKLTEKDRREMAEEKRRNFEERLAFIDRQVAWLRQTPNAAWSRQQNALIDGQYQRKKALDQAMKGAAQLGGRELVELGRELKKGRAVMRRAMETQDRIRGAAAGGDSAKEIRKLRGKRYS